MDLINKTRQLTDYLLRRMKLQSNLEPIRCRLRRLKCRGFADSELQSEKKNSNNQFIPNTLNIQQDSCFNKYSSHFK
jgi:hypothetical protein